MDETVRLAKSGEDDARKMKLVALEYGARLVLELFRRKDAKRAMDGSAEIVSVGRGCGGWRNSEPPEVAQNRCEQLARQRHESLRKGRFSLESSGSSGYDGGLRFDR